MDQTHLIYNSNFYFMHPTDLNEQWARTLEHEIKGTAVGKLLLLRRNKKFPSFLFSDQIGAHGGYVRVMEIHLHCYSNHFSK